MTTTLRRTATALAILAGITTTHTAAAAEEPPTGEPVPFETLAIVSSSDGVNLAPEQILRVRPHDDLGEITDLLAGDYESAFADELVASIGDGVPPGRVVLIGEIDASCTPAKQAGLVRRPDGHLELYAPGHVPEPIECVVAVVTVAVVSVTADEAPAGSTDRADLVDFEPLGYDPDLAVDAEETTDGVPAGYRRFSFVLAGCQHETAELIVTRRVIDARLEHDDPDELILCDQYYRAVFDVDDALVPASADLVH